MSMEGRYLRETKSRAPLIFVLGIIFIVVLLIGLFFFIKGKKKIISPIPPKPSFEVIFYTPTPLLQTPTSTPSGSLKPTKKVAKPTAAPVRKKPTLTPAGKKTTPTGGPTADSSPSPTVEASPTGEPTPTT